MPLSPDWKEVSSVYPDSRPRENKREKYHKILKHWMEPCFCANCGKPQGMISRDWAAYVFRLCDDCVGTHGVPQGMIEAPEHLVRGNSGDN